MGLAPAVGHAPTEEVGEQIGVARALPPQKARGLERAARLPDPSLLRRSAQLAQRPDPAVDLRVADGCADGGREPSHTAAQRVAADLLGRAPLRTNP